MSVHFPSGARHCDYCQQPVPGTSAVNDPRGDFCGQACANAFFRRAATLARANHNPSELILPTGHVVPISTVKSVSFYEDGRVMQVEFKTAQDFYAPAYPGFPHIPPAYGASSNT